MSHSVPEVSIIMPVYNGAEYIESTLMSALAQTFTDFELVIVDDGSTDNTSDIVKNISDPRIKYHYQPNQGAYAARNTAMEIAKAKYLAFLDADDLWIPEKLELQMKEMRKNPDVGIVYGWVEYIDEHNNFIGQKQYNIKDNFYENMLLANYIDNGSMPLIRKECFDTVGGFSPGIWCEDWDMWIRIARFYKMAIVPTYIMKYRIHTEGISKNYKKMEDSLFYVLDREFSCSNLPENLKRKAYAYRYVYLSGVARNLMSYADAFKYMGQALTTSPDIILDKSKNIEILKLILSYILPRQVYKKTRNKLRQVFRKTVAA